MQRGAHARSTKQKAHIQRYEALRDQEAPVIDKKMEMESIGSLSSRMGKTTIEMEHISKSYDGKVILRDFSYVFQRDDRVGFLGPNGCGKTTLMKLIAGREIPTSGDIKIGHTIKIGYYAQELDEDKSHGIEYMDPNIRVIDYIRNTAEYVRTSEGLVSASNMLDRFLFPPDEQYGLIGKLSGGEKRRLNLLRVLMEEPNVLILDEPTNDLDTETLAILEDFLDHFEGIVITVSHDRYFLDRIVSRLFVFEGDGRIKPYEGGYTDYRRQCRAESDSAAEAGNKKVGSTKPLSGTTTGSTKALSGTATGSSKAQGGAVAENGHLSEEAPSKKSWKSEHKIKFSYNEQREWDTIEEDIAILEARLPEIDNEMAANASNFVKLNELTKEKEETEQALEEKMERWEYLSEIYEKMNN